jgi:eukaryotic-like serine/threonine-protein kinase
MGRRSSRFRLTSGGWRPKARPSCLRKARPAGIEAEISRRATPASSPISRARQSAASRDPISWLDRSGKASTLYSAPAVYSNPRVSPDGKRIAFTIATAKDQDIWVKNLDGDTPPTRLTFLSGLPDWIFWTPDSKPILFSIPGGDLYWVDADGSGTAEIIAPKLRMNQGLGTFTADGKKLVLAHPTAAPAGGYVLGIASIEGEKGHRKLGPVEPFLTLPYDQRHPTISPDGKWLAYDSLEAGTVEVYVRPFPGPGGKWRVSNGGGLQPIWSGNGRELVYHNPNTGRAMVMSYSTAGVNSGRAGPNRGRIRPSRATRFSDSTMWPRTVAAWRRSD